VSLEGMKKTTKLFLMAVGILGKIGKGTFCKELRNFAAGEE